MNASLLIRFLVCSLLGFWLLPASLPAQVTGTILGTVLDESNAAVPGATIVVSNSLTGESRTVTSDGSGNYIVTALPVGQYKVEARMDGFKTFVATAIGLEVNQNRRVDARLSVGAVTESVEVTTEAAQVDSYQTQIGAVVDTNRVNDLPLNGRNVYDLAITLPGVSNTNFSTVSSRTGAFLNVNGSRTRQSTFMLDGAFNNDLFRNSGNSSPNPDAIQEFRLITSNFNAEFGRSPGAVFNVVLKSGTNAFHGSAFEFLRNDKLNARPFFQPTVPQLRQNQYGFSVGGPVIRNKTFFFGSFQGLKIRNSAFINSATPPTAAERTGDFSSAVASQRPVDPLTNQAFPGARIPVSRIDSVAANILERYIPLPNTPDNRLEASASSKDNENQYLVKVDHMLNSNHKVYGSIFWINGSSYDPFPSGTQIPNYANNSTEYGQRNMIVSHDWIVSPTMLNQAQFAWSKKDTPIVDEFSHSWSDYGSNVTLGAGPPRPPQIYVNGRWQMGTFGANGQNEQTFSASDTFTVTLGSHTVKAGGWYMHGMFDEIGNWLGAGQVRFTGNFTKNTLADFMLGEAASFRQNNGLARVFRSNSMHGYVQDDWRVSPRVTLNLGLRYEINMPLVSTTDELATFRFNEQSTVIPKAPLGQLFYGDKGIPRGMAKSDLNNLAPRVGIAFDPTGSGRTAIRAGYGVFYAVSFANVTSNLQGQPFLVDVTAFGTPNLKDPWSNVPGGSPFPYTLDRSNPRFSLPVTTNYYDENAATPYVQHYSLAIERQLTSTLTVQAAYVGNTSRKLFFQRDANAPLYIPGKSTAANVNARRPYLPGTFAQIAHTNTGSNAHYDSLQLTFRQRLTKGFSINGAYTFSKSIDEISDDIFSATAVALVDSNNRLLDRGASGSNAPHVFVASYLWDLPETARYGWFGKQVINGWQVSGITRFDSGNPFTVTAGSDTNLDGNANDRADLVGDPKLSGGRSRDEWLMKYFNTEAFAKPATGTPGTAGRSIVYGPGAATWNLSVFKNFELRENHRLQFRSEFFSAFNHPNFSNPNSALNNKNFGRILGAGGARVVQFALKYSF
ncbi:MAG: carboxypeptidase regulatory-like domain-containing protein [Bryobacterales bacterium]|nr:carboxypeptidase regulatory-like domain-containing protein [Bryobacterales bacterium]